MIASRNSNQSASSKLCALVHYSYPWPSKFNFLPYLFVVPGQITYVRTTTIDLQSIAVSWKNPVYLGNGLDGYEVNYKDSGSWKKQPVKFGQNRTVLSGLSPYTNYTFTVSAKSFSGLGPPSEPTQARTLEESELTPLPRVFLLTFYFQTCKEYFCKELP